MAEVKLINVTKRFGKVVAVNDLTLDVHDREFLVLLGPSGCGKTTTMRMVAGLEEVSEGTITIEGRDVTDLPPRKRNVSMIFQNYAVWPHMTVFENIAYALKLKKMGRKAIETTVREVAELTRIGELLERYPSQLSGGQQQRVAVARAIAARPTLVLADEPTANLDSKTGTELVEMMHGLNTEQGVTFLFSSHDPKVIKRAARVVELQDGEVMSDSGVEG